MRDLVQAGTIGELLRVSWIVTTWLRNQSYYDSGGWRGTWKGEGGGVLINQCPHQLDLLQWICGMPCRVQAHCQLGARHRIEVDDEVTAILEYANGATGVFVTSTGEAPGVNRFEVVGDRGTIVIEDGLLRSYKASDVSIRQHILEAEHDFAAPAFQDVELDVPEPGDLSAALMQNFADAVRDPGVALLASGVEGINQVALQNAILMSGVQKRPIDLPFDGDTYAAFLDELKNTPFSP